MIETHHPAILQRFFRLNNSTINQYRIFRKILLLIVGRLHCAAIKHPLNPFPSIFSSCSHCPRAQMRQVLWWGFSCANRPSFSSLRFHLTYFVLVAGNIAIAPAIALAGIPLTGSGLAGYLMWLNTSFIFCSNCLLVVFSSFNQFVNWLPISIDFVIYPLIGLTIGTTGYHVARWMLKLFNLVEV